MPHDVVREILRQVDVYKAPMMNKMTVVVRGSCEGDLGASIFYMCNFEFDKQYSYDSTGDGVPDQTFIIPPELAGALRAKMHAAAPTDLPIQMEFFPTEEEWPVDLFLCNVPKDAIKRLLCHMHMYTVLLGSDKVVASAGGVQVDVKA